MNQIIEATIDKNIPLKGSGTKTGVSDKLKRMEVGDSFAFPSTEKIRLGVLASQLKVRLGLTFTIRKWDAENHRIWRTA